MTFTMKVLLTFYLVQQAFAHSASEIKIQGYFESRKLSTNRNY